MNERPETLFLSRDCLEWLGNESEIKERIGGKIAYSRFFCSFGCGERAEDEITAIYLKGAKRREFEPFVNSLGLGEFENEMLLRTLVAFDRERDELCIRSKLRAGITKNFSLFVTNFKKSVQISPHAFRSSSYLFKNYFHIPVAKHINAAQVYNG